MRLEVDLNPVDANQLEMGKTDKKKGSLSNWLGFLFILAIIFFISHSAIGITVISGQSMAPTLNDNNITLSNQLFYTIERNDIVIFQDENGFDVIKRVIALPNETIEIKDGVVLVNGNPIDEEFTVGIANDMEKQRVADGAYFVMGDNREPGESLDSRSSNIGTIPENRIEGKMLFSFGM
ncbi:signal peptidase I [Robertmurraya massiliosenegalensis]|uniref:signal peptidase I n=1 Tax=Robertmurraya TaxID=2837507 RepID=UPI0039A56B02